jgi:caffeoyl-CoA O-methyltransferase
MNQTARPTWAMSGLLNDEVDRYLYSMLPESDAVLREMEEEADRRRIPIVGPAVGRLLYQYGRMIHARTVFEMGSAIGYSTLWWALAVGETGRVVYTDGDRKNADEARRYFQKAGMEGRIDIRVGDALEILSEQKQSEYDVIFNDVDKEDYPRVLKLAVPRLRKGGLFITDNVLWSGRVARPGEGDDAETRAIREFNRALYASRELFVTLLPLRDGVGVALRL